MTFRGKQVAGYIYHDDVIKWKHFPRNWPFVREIHRSPVNFPHKGQWRGALMFSLIYVWINGWVNNREAGDLRRQHDHYDVIVMPWLGQLQQSVSPAYCPVTHSPAEPSSCCGLGKCSACECGTRCPNLVGTQFEGSFVIGKNGCFIDMLGWISSQFHASAVSKCIPKFM